MLFKIVLIRYFLINTRMYYVETTEYLRRHNSGVPKSHRHFAVVSNYGMR